jgi:hypothetical protein
MRKDAIHDVSVIICTYIEERWDNHRRVSDDNGRLPGGKHSSCSPAQRR